ncbi:MAG: LamG domain-containing protein [Planctomycetota bacterium]
MIYYQSGGELEGYTGLDSALFYSRSDKGTPTQRTGPRFTNIQLVSASAPGTSAKPGRAIGITRGLVGWWKFDDGQGIVARDSSGRGNHGRIKGGAKWAKGRIGGALDFDGTTGCVSVPRIVPNADAFTYAVWISMDALAVGQRSIIHNVGWSRGDVHFAVDGHNQNRLQLGVNGIWPDDYGLLSSHAFSEQDIGKWFHVAGVYDTAGKTWNTYVNGKLDGGRALPKEVPVRIGPALIGGWDNNQRHIDAKLDDVRIYDRALSAAEVKALAAGK